MKRSPRAATLRDVAAECGVSISTVSRALRNPERLNQETLRSVTEAIARLDYRPSIMAQTLRGDRTRLILVIVPSLSPFFLEIFRGAEEAAVGSDYSVLVGHTDRDVIREQQLVEQASAGLADGVILVTSVDLAARTAAAASPIIVALDVSSATSLPTVRVDHVAAATEATRYLIEIGHRRIAHIAGPPTSGMSGHRIKGYRIALNEAGIAFDPALCVEGAFTVESGRLAVGPLLDAPDRPTAIFAANDQMAIGAAQGLRDAGLIVPQDMALFGFDDERIAALYDPPLSTVRIPAFEIGHRAMEQMLRTLDGEPIEMDIVLETELVVRQSAMPPAPAPSGKSQP